MQQGSPHPEDGVLHSRSLSKCQVYLHDPRRPCHRAFHYLEKGMIEILVPAIPADVCKFVSLLRSRILKYATYPRQNDEKKWEENERTGIYVYFSYAKQAESKRNGNGSLCKKKEKEKSVILSRVEKISQYYWRVLHFNLHVGTREINLH